MKRLQLNWPLAAAFVVLCLAWNGLAGASTEDGVIQSYRGSPDLPDAIAFRQFLALIQTGPENPESTDLPIVAQAVGVTPDEHGLYDHVRPHAELFQNAYLAMRREMSIQANALLCTDNRASRTVDEIGDAMNAVDDLAYRVAKTHFFNTINSLSSKEQTAFQAYLDALKLKTSYLRFDSKTQNIDLRIDLERQCLELAQALARMGASE